MKKSSEYVVRFSELTKDSEAFDYTLDEKFFQVFENSIWDSGNVSAKVKVNKRADGITVGIELEGFIRVVCDRCLELYDQEIFVDQSIFLKFGDHEEELDDDLIIIPNDVKMFDLSKVFYDYLVLAIPVKKVHSENKGGGCNRDMIQKLEKHIVDRNTDHIDPRWEELKKLTDKKL